MKINSGFYFEMGILFLIYGVVASIAFMIYCSNLYLVLAGVALVSMLICMWKYRKFMQKVPL